MPQACDCMQFEVKLNASAPYAIKVPQTSPEALQPVLRVQDVMDEHAWSADPGVPEATVAASQFELMISVDVTVTSAALAVAKKRAITWDFVNYIEVSLWVFVKYLLIIICFDFVEYKAYNLANIIK